MADFIGQSSSFNLEAIFKLGDLYEIIFFLKL